jgi:hypothetical protein
MSRGPDLQPATSKGVNAVSTALRTPPPIHEADFLAVDITDEQEILRRFNPLVRQLHSYLNQLPCLRDVPQARRRWRPRARSAEAFGNLVAHARQWYTFHSGGRNEAHFNICLQPTYFSVGLGFEFTLKQGGDPTVVHLAYTCFTNVVRANRSQFERFVANKELEIEWCANEGGLLQFVSTGDAVHWLLNPPQLPVWVFIGRLLRRDQDAAVLEDPTALGKEMEAVLSGFRPIWEQTQVMAHAP